MSPDTQPDAAEANRLYWETELSVADIAQQLDISRRTLYRLVEPVAVAGECIVCAQALVFENRSARTAAVATCTACGAEAPQQDVAADETGEDDDLADIAQNAAEPVVADPDAAMRVGGAALAGAAVGALVTLLLVRRQ